LSCIEFLENLRGENSTVLWDVNELISYIPHLFSDFGEIPSKKRINENIS